jgi:intein/homing endonuclease
MNILDETLFNLGSKLSRDEYEFGEFVLKVFSQSFPGKGFDTWHIRQIIEILKEVMDRGERLVVVWPRYHLKSVHPDTLVLMADGTHKRIDDVLVGDIVVSYSHPGKRGYSLVLRKGETFQPTIKIHLENGSQIITSVDHRLFVNMQYLEASHIKVGDLVAVPKYVETLHDTFISEDDAILLGYWYSEGTTDLTSLSISNEGEFCLEELKAIASRKNWNWSSPPSDPSTIQFARKNKLDVAPGRHMKLLGVDTKEHLPSSIVSAPDNIVAIFLNRYWYGDGTISDSAPYLSCCSEHESLLKEIQALLWRFGIASSISSSLISTRTKGNKRYYDLNVQDRVSVLRFKEKIGFSKPNHITTFEEILIKFEGSIPRGDVVPGGWQWGLPFEERAKVLDLCNADAEYSGNTTRQKVERAYSACPTDELIPYFDNDIAWSRVRSVTPSPIVQRLVDVNLDPEGSLVGNGIVSHNSTVVGYATTIYRLLQGHDMLYLSYRDSMSRYHTANIKEIVATNPILSKRMEDMSPLSEAMCKFRVDGVKTVRVLSGGVFSFKRGTHVSGGAILDDILRDPESPLSFIQVKKVEQHVLTEIINIPNKGAPMIIMGTPMHPADLLMTLEHHESFRHVRWPVYEPVPGRHILWPEMYDEVWLEEHKKASGWRSFQTEFMLVPVSETESFFRSDEVFALVDATLRNHSLYAQFSRPENARYILGGVDIGKKRHPSHLSVFVIEVNGKGEPFATMIHQSFMDEMPYMEQKDYLETAVRNFNMDALYVDNSRGEMEERDLDPAIRLVTFASQDVRKRAITATEKIFSLGNVKLLGEPRFISQILSVNGSLQAPETSQGHGESFFSIVLTMLALDDRLGLGGIKNLGDMNYIMQGKSIDLTTGIFCPKCKSPAVTFSNGFNYRPTIQDANTCHCLDCGETWSLLSLSKEVKV